MEGINTGDGYIRISADISEAMSLFNGLDVNRKAIQGRLLKTVGNGAKQAVKKNLNHYLQRRSGTLYKSITSRLTPSMRSVVITNNASSGKPTSKRGQDARYGFMLAAGYEITLEAPQCMTFNINGKWVRTHHIKVTPKDFVEPSVERYTNSADCEQRLDKELQKQVDYWDKKLAGRK